MTVDIMMLCQATIPKPAAACDVRAAVAAAAVASMHPLRSCPSWAPELFVGHCCVAWVLSAHGSAACSCCHLYPQCPTDAGPQCVGSQLVHVWVGCMRLAICAVTVHLCKQPPAGRWCPDWAIPLQQTMRHFLAAARIDTYTLLISVIEMLLCTIMTL